MHLLGVFTDDKITLLIFSNSEGGNRLTKEMMEDLLNAITDLLDELDDIKTNSHQIKDLYSDLEIQVNDIELNIDGLERNLKELDEKIALVAEGQERKSNNFIAQDMI
jgi:chromosome segregation ATPase